MPICQPPFFAFTAISLSEKRPTCEKPTFFAIYPVSAFPHALLRFFSWQIETSSPSAHPSLSFLFYASFLLRRARTGSYSPSSSSSFSSPHRSFAKPPLGGRKEEEAALEGVLLHMRKGGKKKKVVALSSSQGEGV